MYRKRLLGAAAWIALPLFGQGLDDLGPQLPVSDAVCTHFLNQQPASTASATPRLTGLNRAAAVGRLTREVANALPPLPGGTRSGAAANSSSLGLIDKYIFAAIEDAGVQPADPTTDWEFIRRVTLDLTGRIPTPSAVLAFVADTTPGKRAALVSQLLTTPQWVDKWTMFYGDLFKNNSSNTQIQRYQPGVEAFYNYIRSSIAANKPYDQMAREIITAQGDNSYTTGEINYVVGGVVTGGPVQDVYDQQTANIADTFLGIAHMNCLLCHDGRGHLTGLSLWGGQQTRVEAWGMAAFLSKTYTSSSPVSSAATTPRYWSVTESSNKANGYALNTTTGNRPPRQPYGTVKAASPAYIFTGETPQSGENYRAALARMITADPQFARAAVNYLWAYFFGVGLVDPPDQFDPLRQDPDNPPPAGWTLQASNPRLLNALTQAFVANKYDVKWLMTQIVNSSAYQLSSRYNGQWNPLWDTLYARKMVRRLWGEEIHDAIAVSSNNIPSYNVGATYGTLSYAMQFPEPAGLQSTPDGNNGNIAGFLNAFLRGNRDDQPRSQDGSILQVLNLMNDPFVIARVSPTSPANGLLAQSLPMSNTALVNNLFLNVLSRYPTAQEMTTALGNLSNSATRTTEAQNLLWTLYNKVDFIFNY